MGKGPGSSAIRKRELCVIRFVAIVKGEAGGRKDAEKPKRRFYRENGLFTHLKSKINDLSHPRAKDADTCQGLTIGNDTY